MKLTARSALIVVGTAGYLGLAVLGFGGLAAFFSRPALIALVVATFVLFCTSVFAGGNVNPGVREDRGNRWVLVAFTLIGLLDAYLPAYTDRKEFWTIAGAPRTVCLRVRGVLPDLFRAREGAIVTGSDGAAC